MQRWEYCSIFAVGMDGRSMTPRYPTLYTFTIEGTKEQSLSGKEFHELGKLIARLGQDGWEMVGTGALVKPDGHALYFKRLLNP